MPFRLKRHIEGLLGARRKVKLAGQAQPVRGVARLQLRIQLVRGLEVRRMQRPPVALEAVAQRRKRAVLVHPFAQIAEDLLAGLVAVQRFQLAHSLGCVSRMKASTVSGKMARSRSKPSRATGT
jgi:hypothetical protein